jgi:hypothetical protein
MKLFYNKSLMLLHYLNNNVNCGIAFDWNFYVKLKKFSLNIKSCNSEGGQEFACKLPVYKLQRWDTLLLLISEQVTSKERNLKTDSISHIQGMCYSYLRL